MIWTAVLIGAVPMAVTVYFAQNLLKNQRPVVYYGGLIGAGLLAWQITEWLDRRYRLSRPDLFGSEDDDYNNFGEINCEDCGGAIKVLYQVGSDGPEQGWCDC